MLADGGTRYIDEGPPYAVSGIGVSVSCLANARRWRSVDGCFAWSRFCNGRTVNPSRKLPRFESWIRHTVLKRPLACENQVRGRSRSVRPSLALNGQKRRPVGHIVGRSILFRPGPRAGEARRDARHLGDFAIAATGDHARIQRWTPGAGLDHRRRARAGGASSPEVTSSGGHGRLGRIFRDQKSAFSLFVLSPDWRDTLGDSSRVKGRACPIARDARSLATPQAPLTRPLAPETMPAPGERTTTAGRQCEVAGRGSVRCS
jgi:hypothetical protein